MKEKPVGRMVPLELYRTAMEQMPLVTVDIMFLSPDKTRILLGKRTNEPYAGQFYSFGGRLFKNESFLGAACRIAKQETGLIISPSALIFAGVLNEISDNSIFEGVNYHAVDVYFACTIGNESMKLDSQHSEMRWFPVDDPGLHPNVKTRIEGALRALKNV